LTACHLYNPEFKNKWSYTDISPYVLMACTQTSTYPICLSYPCLSSSILAFCSEYYRIRSVLELFFSFAKLFICNSDAIDAAFILIYVSVPSSVVHITHVLTHDALLWYKNKNWGKICQSHLHLPAFCYTVHCDVFPL